MSDPKVWMPFFVADYLADTGHLGTIEHGAYLLLILHYWRSAKPLPSDEGQLRKIARMTPVEWTDARGVLLDFFDLDGNLYRHSRIDDELHDASTRIAAKSRGGRAAAAKRWQSNAAANADALAEQKHNDAPSPSPSPSPSQEQSQSQEPVEVRANARRPKATRWDSEAVVSEEWLREGELRRVEHGLPSIDLRLEAVKFKNYWAGKSGQAATKVDWHLTWMNWVLKAEGTRNGRGNGTQQQGRGIGAAAADAIAKIRREAGDDSGGTHPSGQQCQVLTIDSGARENHLRSGDIGGNHRGADGPRPDFSLPDFLDRREKPAVSGLLQGPRALPD